jgi:hypothetical protein
MGLLNVTACKHGQSVGAEFCVACLRERVEALEAELAAARNWMASARVYIAAANASLREKLRDMGAAV